MEDKLTQVIQMGYSDTKEGMEAPQLNLIDKVFMNIVHEGLLETLLVANIDALTSDRFMDTLTQRMVSNKSLIALGAASVKPYL